MDVVIHTDGACRYNPGPGGWGVWLQWGDHDRELFGGQQDTTNNRMELMAAIRGLAALSRPCNVILYTDSEYLRKGITEWITQWKQRGWKTAAKKPVKNADLWRELDGLVDNHRIDWRWVKGHSGDPGNEKADELANRGVDALLASGEPSFESG
jgi:ribonuclease HI